MSHRQEPTGSTGPDNAATARLARAVVYLRVSTSSQVNTDYDPEGISIPAQRLACERKAEQLGNVVIVDEYLEPGKTATSMDGRPAFQAMLNRIKTERDVDMVLIYKLSRMNRNRLDDALVMAELRKHRVTLVSATENIDDTPVGQLMHGILASFNEFRSAEEGADIRYKMGEKAKKGGTLGRAPIGYTNTIDRIEGREIRAVAIDPERGPLIRQAFELYATGRYTLEGLCDVLYERGLRSRPGRFPAGRMTDGKLSVLLRNRYYLGIVTYKGDEYPGRHEPLVDQETFDRCQAILDAKRTSAERQRVWHHYLKGSLWCGACHRRGRESRMILQRAQGKGGVYFYFFCRGRQERVCDEPFLQVGVVEQAVIEHYQQVSFEDWFVEDFRSQVIEIMDDDQHSTTLLRRQLNAQLAKLDVQESNLIDLAAGTPSAKQKVRSRLLDIDLHRQRLRDELVGLNSDIQVGAELINFILDLLAKPSGLYGKLTDSGRRQLNQAVFNKIYIHRHQVVADDINEPFRQIVHMEREARRLGREDCRRRMRHEAPETETPGLPSSEDGQAGSLSKTSLVGETGFEPAT